MSFAVRSQDRINCAELGVIDVWAVLIGISDPNNTARSSILLAGWNRSGASLLGLCNFGECQNNPLPLVGSLQPQQLTIIEACHSLE